MAISKWVKQKLKALLIRVVRAYFNREFLELHLDQAQLNKDFLALLLRQQNVELALRQIHVGAVANPGGGSWVVLGYQVGDRPYVSFYDLDKHNMGAFRELLERYEKSGMAVLCKSPFARTPVRRKA